MGACGLQVGGNWGLERCSRVEGMNGGLWSLGLMLQCYWLMEGLYLMKYQFGFD